MKIGVGITRLLVMSVMFLSASACYAQLHEAFIPTKESVVRDWCFRNQLIVADTIFLYNIDIDNKGHVLKFEDKLVREPGLLIPKYLKRPISQEYGCHYSGEKDIVCSVHGTHRSFDKPGQVLTDFKNASKRLVAKGCSVDGADKDGVTALHLAVDIREPEIVEYLLSINANPSLRTNEGYNALDIAVRDKSLEIAQILQKYGAKGSQSIIDAANEAAGAIKVDSCSGTVEIR